MVAAMFGVPALLENNIPGTIAGIFSAKEDWAATLQLLDTRGLSIGLWLGIVGGAYLTLRLFRVADGSWTTFVLAILALLLVGQVFEPEFAYYSSTDTSAFNDMSDRLVQNVAVICLVARGVTRFARNRRL